MRADGRPSTSAVATVIALTGNWIAAWGCGQYVVVRGGEGRDAIFAASMVYLLAGIVMIAALWWATPTLAQWLQAPQGDRAAYNPPMISREPTLERLAIALRDQWQVEDVVADLALLRRLQGKPPINTALAEGRRRDIAAGRTLVGPHRADLPCRPPRIHAPWPADRR